MLCLKLVQEIDFVFLDEETNVDIVWIRNFLRIHYLNFYTY